MTSGWCRACGEPIPEPERWCSPACRAALVRWLKDELRVAGAVLKVQLAKRRAETQSKEKAA